MGDAFDILMVTHAELSKGYFSAMELILDINNEDMEIVSFEAGEALDVFSEKLAEIIEKKYKHRKIIVLLDLPGGTPANMALPFLSASRKLVAGINLPFVLELMIAKKNWDFVGRPRYRNMIENAKSSMVFYNKLLKTEEIL